MSLLDGPVDLGNAVFMSDVEAVLAANADFYRAFSSSDMDALEELWAEGVAVACIHPGWPILRGRKSVMASWKSILSAPNSPAIGCSDATAEVLGDFAYVTCVESLDSGRLVATNLFAREDGRWRLVHHQAGAVSPAFESDEDNSSGTVH